MSRPSPRLPFVEGLTRYTGPLGSVFRTTNGLPAIGPPWASIVAYDLNEGAIKWRAFDKDSGLPSVFEVGGRKYVAFTASYYASLPEGSISTYQGKVENQGYYVFALPK